MERLEAIQMERLEINQNGFEVSMLGPKMRERIRINSPYPDDIYSKAIFGWLGTMHLIAPYLPKIIRTDFTLSPLMRKLISAMYQWEFENQRIKLEKENRNGESDGSSSKIQRVEKILPEYEHPDSPPIGFWSPLKTSRKRVAIAYSAGKDSIWNLWRATEQYGSDNVLVVHIRNLNKNNGSNEIAWVKKQQKCFGFKHLEVIDLINSSLNTGYQTMRSRDLFLAGIIAPLAIEFGAGQIITEGFAEEAPREPFSGQEWNMLYFNSILERLHIPVQVSWKNRKEMDVIKDLYRHRPEWMPYVCNCFTLPCFHSDHRKKFMRRSPTISLYPSQCGVCPKCRITLVARILYDASLQGADPKDIRIFLNNTIHWFKDSRNTHHDMLTESFHRDFRIACKKYGVVV